jgi:hypothetical protein
VGQALPSPSTPSLFIYSLVYTLIFCSIWNLSKRIRTVHGKFVALGIYQQSPGLHYEFVAEFINKSKAQIAGQFRSGLALDPDSMYDYCVQYTYTESKFIFSTVSKTH